jgi:hypothetical protein
MSLTAYIRYDHTGRIVPGGPIVVKDKPANGNWQVVTEGTNVTLSGKLRAFVKVDRFGKPLAGSLFLGKERPATGKWLEVDATFEGSSTPTTTTTTSSSTSTTTTTTTTVGINIYNIYAVNLNTFSTQDPSWIAYVRTPITVYSALNQPYGPGCQLFLNPELTAPLCENSNVPGAVRRVGQSETYSYSTSMGGFVGNYPDNLTKSFHIGGRTNNLDYLAINFLNEPTRATAVFNNLFTAWSAGGSQLTLGLQLYNDFNLTNPWSDSNIWLCDGALMTYGFPTTSTTPVYEITNGIVDSQTGVISQYTYNILNGTGVASSAIPCNQFSPNGVTLAPGVTELAIGVTVYNGWNGFNWANLGWPYLTDETYIYEVNGSSVITSQALCSSITTTTTTTEAPTTTTTTTVASYTIGQQALGGTIAYILQPGDPGYDANIQHGLVATINDISTGASWGCFGTEIIGADGTAIGTGNQNTIDIVGGCSTSGIAAQLSIDLVEGGYSDWYLPSRDELNTLYVNSSIIGGFDTGQYSGYYWSSSEYLDGSFQNAYTQSFFNGTQTQSSKLNANRVRPVRSF